MPQSKQYQVVSRSLTCSEERGVFLVFLAVGIVALVAALAFAIDIPQKEVVSHEVQRSVDAGALAGAQQINGTLAGMHQAVNVINQTMALNHVGGSPIPVSDYQIEFGFYSFPDKEFRTLAVGQDYSDANALARHEYGDVPVVALANAVRVVAHATAPSIFSGIFGFVNLGTVTGQSVATANSNPKVCAFPIAIPFCSLFLNQDPNRSDLLVTEEFEAETQCQRPVFITNANYQYERNNGLATDRFRADRYGGFERSLRYPRRERVTFADGNVCGAAPGSFGSNCLSRQITGTFVLPKMRDVDGDGQLDGDDGDGQATIDEFSSFLSKVAEHPDPQGKGYCLDFEIGESLAPLDYAKVVSAEGESIVSAEFEQTLRQMFASQSAKKFTSVFQDPRTVSSANLPKNYPFLQDLPIDRVDGFGQIRTLGPKMGSWEWTNPLCHDNGYLADDLDNAKVLSVVVPVIMPAREFVENPNSFRYCDPNSEVGTDPYLTNFAAQSETRPQIVGFIEVDLIDFNFRWLANEGANAIRASYTNQSGQLITGERIEDRNTIGGLLE